MLHALAAVPAFVVLLAAVVVALGTGSPSSSTETLSVGMDVGRARVSLMAAAPIGIPVDVAFNRLQERGLSCAVSAPPLVRVHD